ncbi:MAG: helix-turn-helix transcriptional regulator [Flammeovirgaceae bacterium]|nr:helix-turn-helix transcriptional regulator [Flammeovirgaceae bacterium]
MQLGEAAEKIFYKGKVFEILGLYFSSKTPDVGNCPFLRDEEAVRKIKQAKDYILKNPNTTHTLKALSKLIGLNEYQLKSGFKEVYGTTVFGFILDHKLDQARFLLDKGQHHVNEVAFEIGYTNPSHFIAAFKKKFGMTPKKYMMAQTPKKTY